MPGAGNRGFKKGQGALRAGSALKKSASSSKRGRTAPNGEKDVKSKMTQFRSENTINRLNMYKDRTKSLSRDQKVTPQRIQPDRRWFGNTRVIAQNKMQAFRETLSKGVDDPFSVVLRSSKLPMSLLKDTEDKASRMNLLQVEPFKEVFSGRRRQKRVKLGSYDLEGLMQSVSQKTQGYDGNKDKRSAVDVGSGLVKAAEDKYSHAGEEIFNKGTSKRIWGELYKVVDCSDVLIFVLDARDPMGTRCKHLEREIRKNRPGKHIVLLLNKVDLIPTWATRRWVQVLTKEFPTLAFHASITNPFGKNALLNLLRQFGVLIKERKHLTIGMIGYPNVGKSSVINTMKHKKVCKAAPIPGETRVWQYISLTKKLYLLDCPGFVPAGPHDFAADTAKVLKGVVRVEKITDASQYIDEVLSRVKRPYLIQRYKLPADADWATGDEFLAVIARKMGKLRAQGEPDIEVTARMVLKDWQRGLIPFFQAPPEDDDAPQAAKVTIGRPGSSSSGSRDPASTAAAGEDDVAKAIKDDDLPTPNSAAEAMGPVRQSLAELSCSVVYDEEDRRGEELPKEKESGFERRERKDEDLKATWKKRKAARKEGEEYRGVEKERPEGEAEVQQPKKKKRRGKGLFKGKSNEAASSTAGAGSGMQVPRESMDWSKVVAEFDM
jgi:nuclear GTP-binding protein